jgi:hypothetical protein
MSPPRHAVEDLLRRPSWLLRPPPAQRIPASGIAYRPTRSERGRLHPRHALRLPAPRLAHRQARPELLSIATEMALCVLGYNLTRVLNTVGMKPLLAAVRA